VNRIPPFFTHGTLQQRRPEAIIVERSSSSVKGKKKLQ